MKHPIYLWKYIILMKTQSPGFFKLFSSSLYTIYEKLISIQGFIYICMETICFFFHFICHAFHFCLVSVFLHKSVPHFCQQMAALYIECNTGKKASFSKMSQGPQLNTSSSLKYLYPQFCCHQRQILL